MNEPLPAVTRALRLNVNYRVFTVDHDEDAAAARFVELYGQHPEQIIEQDGLLWVGPVPEKEG